MIITESIKRFNCDLSQLKSFVSVMTNELIDIITIHMPRSHAHYHAIHETPGHLKKF